MTEASPLPAGSTIGILGGGQLGRMLSMAAARLGYRCHVLCPQSDSPAFAVCAAHTAADYDDRAALDSFARSVSVVTYEFENVPVDTAFHLERHVPVYPSPSALYMAQDRRNEKIFLTDLDIAAAPFAAIDSAEALSPALSRLGAPAILKTRRLGYDGKGQMRINAGADLGKAWTAVGAARSIIETVMSFEREVSVVAARGHDGAFAAYPPVWNIHEDHILKTTRAPALMPESLATEATAIARRIVDALEYRGVMGIEMFVLGEGASQSLAVNEMAPRVHNSGHWTMDGAVTDQFEQHIRAIASLPLGSTAMTAEQVEMTNLIGTSADDVAGLLTESDARVHLYGKAQSRPGRKMGHVNRRRWSQTR